jgi:L-aspartate oxidase
MPRPLPTAAGAAGLPATAQLPRALVAVDPARHPTTDVDVLVVGSGIAGLSLALALPASRSVLVATKAGLRDGATPWAQGGIAGALPGGADSPHAHAADTLAAGAGLCDPEAVAVLTGQAGAAIEGLIARGVAFDPGPGPAGLALTREGGHSHPRILHAGGDATGAEVERALAAAAHAAPNLTVAEGIFLVDLLTDGDGAVTGAVLLDGPGRRLHLIRAGAVVLATGGAGRLFDAITSPAQATGDGIAAALRAGAELADVEFTQFHPTALFTRGDPRPLVSEALRGEGAVLRDQHGDRVMDGVHPLGDLAPRDVVARAMAIRMAALGLDHLLLDATHLDPGRLQGRFPTVVSACRAAGLDPATRPLPVAPAAHYSMGGVRTDLDGRTTLPRLYAVGETACTGVHGANRLASNSLLEGAVFAARAARHIAATRPRPARGPTWATRLQPADRPAAGGTPRPSALVRRAMTSLAGLRRTGPGLAQAAAVLAPATRPPGRLDPAETANLAHLGTAIILLAARRHESRGAHWRADAPAADSAWRRRQTVTRAPDGTLVPDDLPVTMTEPAPTPPRPPRPVGSGRRSSTTAASTSGSPSRPATRSLWQPWTGSGTRYWSRPCSRWPPPPGRRRSPPSTTSCWTQSATAAPPMPAGSPASTPSTPAPAPTRKADHHGQVERIAMLTNHEHRPGEFDAGHCRACAREAGLLQHYHRVQREEDTLRVAQRSAWRARTLAIWALCSSGAGIVLAAIALLVK